MRLCSISLVQSDSKPLRCGRMKSDGGADPRRAKPLDKACPWTRQVFAVFHQHYQKKMIMMHSDAVDICDEGWRGGGSRTGDQRRWRQRWSAARLPHIVSVCTHAGAWNTTRTANPPFDYNKTNINNATNDVRTPRGLRWSSSCVFGGIPPTDSPFSSVCRFLLSLHWYITRENDSNQLYIACGIECSLKFACLMSITKVLADLQHEKYWKHKFFTCFCIITHENSRRKM
jgi:hypothetical protein